MKKDIKDKMELIMRNAEEVVTPEELHALLKKGGELKGYIGVEPSGLFHIGWSIWVQKLADLIDVGVNMVVFEATWHAAINDKLGGDLEKIRNCAKYLEHCLFSLGIDPTKVNFLTAEDLMKDLSYWEIVMRSAKNMSLSRVKRAMTIMGREEAEAELDFSKCIYPALQVSDIFALDLSVCLSGLDQRRAHILAREIAPKLGIKKPVAIHTPLLMGLSGLGRMDLAGKLRKENEVDPKMSKSKPETAIFIHDSPKEIERKIRAAYCPIRKVVNNPVMDINRKIIFKKNDNLSIDRSIKHGGLVEVHSFDELAKIYIKDKLHPLDLKNATSKALVDILKPVREYFKKNREATELLKEMKRITVTR
ncbi:tyrosine--tRNA ligase [Candidatus Bathyarchaeota archaeon]|nr:tyrosine--tRNA ligase [Candidatus Bathyarchaeota archaeon]